MNQDKYQEPVNGQNTSVPAQPQSNNQTQETPEPVSETPVNEPQPQTEPQPEESTDQPQPDKNSVNAQQIERLVNIAFSQGITEAIEEARKLNNPYILDEFHDALTNDFYQKLVEAGKLEQK